MIATTIKNIQDDFLVYLTVEKGLSQNTLLAYKNDINQFLHFYLKQAPTPIEQLKGIDDSQVIRYFENRKISGLKESSLLRSMTSIKSFIEYWEEKIGVVNDRHYPSFKKTLNFPDYLSVEEILRIIDIAANSKLHNERNVLIIKILYGLGLRVSELINLSMNDLDAKEEIIWVKGKGNKDRILPLPTGLMQEVSLYALKKKSGVSNLFLNKNGGSFSRVGIWKLVKSLCFKAGIKRNVYPHIFRHSFATHMLSNGADIRTVQALLGHEDISSTEIYTHLTTEYLKSVVKDCHPHYRNIES